MTPSAAGNRVTPGQPARELTKNELAQFLTAARESFGKIRTLKTYFVQEKHMSIFTDIIEARGICLFRNPGMVRMDFTEPFQSSLIVNNGSVTKYEFVEGKWKKLDPAGKEVLLMVMGNITSWFCGRFNDNNLYDITARKNGKICLRLIPKNDEFRKYIHYFDLGINEHQNGLEYIVIMEPGKDYTRIDFNKDVINSGFPVDYFNNNGPVPTPISHW